MGKSKGFILATMPIGKKAPDIRIMVKLYPYQVPAGVIRKLAEMGVQA